MTTPSSAGDYIFAKCTRSAIHTSELVHTRRGEALEGCTAWLLIQEAAKQLAVQGLRTHFGPMQQTLAGLEKALQQALTASLKTGLSEAYKGARLLLEFVTALERVLQECSDGSTSLRMDRTSGSLPAAQQRVRTQWWRPCTSCTRKLAIIAAQCAIIDS